MLSSEKATGHFTWAEPLWVLLKSPQLSHDRQTSNKFVSLELFLFFLALFAPFCFFSSNTSSCHSMRSFDA
jgi:hypothetical protein